MDIIFDAANMLIDDANKDEELREWFKSLNSYIHKVRCLLILTLSVLRVFVYVALGRSFSKQATSSNPTATPVAAKFATPVVNSTMENIKITSTTCSRQLEIGSRPWAMTRLINASERIGPGSPKTCCSIVKAV